MKKAVSAVLSICILIMSFATSAFAAIDNSGTCGENLTWSYDAETKVLTIEGYGDMTNYFSNRKVPWKHARKEAVEISMPQGLTHIGDYAFFGFENISEINIPSSVKTVGNSVFAACKSVTSVHIPNGVQRLGGWVFASCTSLENINFPSSLTSIDYECFINCPSLMDVTIPSTLTSIERFSLGILQSHAFNYDMIIRGVPGSNAQSYAQNNFLRFVSVYADRNAVSNLTRTLEGKTAGSYSLEQMDINGDGMLSIKDSLLFKIDMDE